MGPTTHASNPPTAAECSTAASAGMGTAARTTRKRAAAKYAFKQPGAKAPPPLLAPPPPPTPQQRCILDVYSTSRKSHVSRPHVNPWWGWIFFERTRILSGIQFTKHFIEFFVVEANQLVGNNSNVILSRQTCGQRSSMFAGSKHRAPQNYFSVRICYVSPQWGGYS